MAPVLTAFCDANVLYSVLLRDLLIRMRAASTGTEVTAAPALNQQAGYQTSSPVADMMTTGTDHDLGTGPLGNTSFVVELYARSQLPFRIAVNFRRSVSVRSQSALIPRACAKAATSQS